MFRASDIFGRKPGQVPNKPQPKAAPSDSDVPKSREWDPATGTWVEDELPADVQEMMGIKKARVDLGPVRSPDAAPRRPEAATDASRGYAASAPRAPLRPPPPPPPPAPAMRQFAWPKVDHRHIPQEPVSGGLVFTSPSVEYWGFAKEELNNRYYEQEKVPLNSRPSYWTKDGRYFLYWQSDPANRWALCDAGSLHQVREGHFPGWAFSTQWRHPCNANGWQESRGQTWAEPFLTARYRSSSHHKRQLEDHQVADAITSVEFQGFKLQEMNTRYTCNPKEVLQNKPSFWDSTGIYFIYWQEKMLRWAICDRKCLDAVREGQCPGWAYKVQGTGHFANACGWKEVVDSQWHDAEVETTLVSIVPRRLVVDFSGFAKQELNTRYSERPEEVLQGRPSFWDPAGNFFIYWQQAMSRWAIVDSTSLDQVRAGSNPGWAYRADSLHFTKSRGWMEVWNNAWRAASVMCTVIDGTVPEEPEVNVIAAEPAQKEVALPQLSGDQWKLIIEKVYQEKNPEKVKDLPPLFKKFAGHEANLFQTVCLKYNVNIQEFLNAFADADIDGQPE